MKQSVPLRCASLLFILGFGLNAAVLFDLLPKSILLQGFALAVMFFGWGWRELIVRKSTAKIEVSNG